MVQRNYASEYSRNLMEMQQTAGGVPVLDLTNWQASQSGNSQIRSLPRVLPTPLPVGACHSVAVKTTVDGKVAKCPIFVESSIVTCNGESNPGGVPAGEGGTPPMIPATCPIDALTACPADGVISTTTWVNMIAMFTMGAPQNNVEVTFKYVEDGVPNYETVTVNVAAGLNHVYAFSTNKQYDADTTLVLYGAEILA